MKEYYVSTYCYRFHSNPIFSFSSFLIKHEEVFKDNIHHFLNACSDETLRRFDDSSCAGVMSWMEIKER